MNQAGGMRADPLDMQSRLQLRHLLHAAMQGRLSKVCGSCTASYCRKPQQWTRIWRMPRKARTSLLLPAARLPACFCAIVLMYVQACKRCKHTGSIAYRHVQCSSAFGCILSSSTTIFNLATAMTARTYKYTSNAVSAVRTVQPS